MSKNIKIIVAHPDDEVIFFSSILKSASKIIFCFDQSQDKIVNLGRRTIKKSFPLKNACFLNIKEANIFNEANWKYPEKKSNDFILNKNRFAYRKNYLKLKSYLLKIITKGDTIYTHNPWGEYGHEDHVLVFNVIKSLKIKFQLSIFVNNYVSNKSYNFMRVNQHLLSNTVQNKTIDKKLVDKLKKFYISNLCWTFDDNYKWPKKEIFIKINSNIKSKYQKINNTKVPLNFLSGNYKVNFISKCLAKIINYKQKKRINQIVSKFKLFKF
jgi:hypothetical protein